MSLSQKSNFESILCMKVEICFHTVQICLLFTTAMHTRTMPNKHSGQCNIMWLCHNRLFMWISGRLRQKSGCCQAQCSASQSASTSFLDCMKSSQIFRAIFDPGACHLPNEWPSFPDSWASQSPSYHETNEPTVLLFTAEDCFGQAHLHTFREWHEGSIITIIVYGTVYGGLLLKDQTQLGRTQLVFVQTQLRIMHDKALYLFVASPTLFFSCNYSLYYLQYTVFALFLSTSCSLLQQ